MEVQLRELIEQIKKDGVSAAEEEARLILNEARSEAEKIITEAREQADKIISEAKAETEKMTEASEESIRQAGRNLLISFRESVTAELKAITERTVSATYSSEAMPQLIADVIKITAENSDTDDISVILNTEKLEELEETLLTALKEKMLTGVMLKAGDSFDGGFRIAVNNGNAYYDYSVEAVTDMLSGYLSPRAAKLLKEAE